MTQGNTQFFGVQERKQAKKGGMAEKEQLSLSSSSVAKELHLLGDPSGRQDGSYWDGWFDAVCRRQDHRSFEWYCSSDEVLRVVTHHLLSFVTPSADDCDRQQQQQQQHYTMIHPGSGTSLVPVKLREAFPGSQHVVVDISSVAIDEMRGIHEQQHHADDSGAQVLLLRPIEYVVTDLLKNGALLEASGDDGDDDDDNGQVTPVVEPFQASTFDCWIDKGFVDAIFSKEKKQENREKSARLFQEACRILKPATGFALVVSLAEDHSLQILIENWLSNDDCNDNDDTGYYWQPTLHAWELEPISGDLPPFAFVLTKNIAGTTTNGEACGRIGSDCDSSNSTDGESNSRSLRLVWHHRRMMDTAGHSEERALGKDAALMEIQECIAASRRRFSEARANQAAKTTSVRTVMATLEVKPCDDQVDLVALGETLRSEEWIVADAADERRKLRPQWRPFSDGDHSEPFRIAPIGFGISKLVLKCVIPSDDLDDLVALIEEWNDDLIQSVDVDWQNTVPLGDISDLLQHGKK